MFPNNAECDVIRSCSVDENIMSGYFGLKTSHQVRLAINETFDLISSIKVVQKSTINIVAIRCLNHVSSFTKTSETLS